MDMIGTVAIRGSQVGRRGRGEGEGEGMGTHTDYAVCMRVV